MNSAMRQRTWQITAPATGWVLAGAPTEGQAWLVLMDWDGGFVDGWKLIGAAGHFRALGYHAVEVTIGPTEAHGDEDPGRSEGI